MSSHCRTDYHHPGDLQPQKFTFLHFWPRNPDQGVETPYRSSRGGPSHPSPAPGGPGAPAIAVTSAQPLLRRHTAPLLRLLPCVSHKSSGCWIWGHPGDSGQPQLEIPNRLPLSKDPFFQITFQGSSAQDVHPSLGAPSQPTVTGEQSRAGESLDARGATGPMGGSNQIASLDEKPGAVEGRGLRAMSQDGADRQARGC